VDVNLPSLTEKDERDIRAGVAAGIGLCRASFVRRSDDVLVLRALLDSPAPRRGSSPKSRIRAACGTSSRIVKAGPMRIMVARGDLGIEIDYHVLPWCSAESSTTALAEGKPGLIATHLLESMITASCRPARRSPTSPTPSASALTA